MKKQFLAIAAIACTAVVWAAVPVALWEGNFTEDGQQITRGDVTYTLHLNGNTIQTAEDGTTYLQIENTAHGTAGVTVDVGTVPESNPGGTLVVKFSNASYGADQWGTLMTLCCTKMGGYTNITSLTVGDASGTLHGQWGEGHWSDRESEADTPIDDTTVPLDGTVCSLALAYGNGTGTFAFRRTGDGAWTDAYRLKGWGGDTYNLMGFSVGGPHTQPCQRSNAFAQNCRPVAGMRIYAIAYMPEAVTAVAAMGAFAWPSEVKEFRTAAPVSGAVDWSAIAFDHNWASSYDALVTIELAGDAEITVPAGFVANTINFIGEYNVVIKSADDTLPQIGMITGEAMVTRIIPEGYTAPLTVRTGEIYRLLGTADANAPREYAQVFTVNGVLETSGNVKLSGNNVINGTGAVLRVLSGGVARIRTAGTGLSNYGQIIIEKGAVLQALNTDAGNYNGANWSVHVYGTLDFGGYRWTFKGTDTRLALYGGGRVIGAGDANGAVDLWSCIDVLPDPTGESDTATIAAPVKWSNGGAEVSVAEGMTLDLAAIPTTGYQKFTKTGAGTLRVSADQGITGVIAINAGTLELNNASVFGNGGSVTIAENAVLRVVGGTHTLTSCTISGTLEVTDGVATVDASVGCPVSVTGGTLKVVITDAQWSAGCTLGDNFKVTGDVVFVDGKGNEVTGSGTVLAAQGIHWIGGAEGLWSEAANWSNGAVPAAADHVILDVADAVVTVAAEDVAPAAVIVRANATLRGTFADFGSVTLENAATLTVDGTGGFAGVQGGTFVKEGEGTVRITQNVNGFSLQDTKVVVKAGTLDTAYAFKDLDLTIAEGATVTHDGWASGCVGTLVLACEDTAFAFANSGGSSNNIKIGGFTSVVKKGAGTMTLKAGFSGNTVIEIQEGKLILDTTVNQTDDGVTIMGSGAFDMTAGSEIPASALAGFGGEFPSEGVIRCGTTLPTAPTLLEKLQSEQWTGVVAFVGNTDLTNFDPNLYGNTNSIVRLKGCAGYFRQSNSAAGAKAYMTVLPTVDFVGGGNGVGMRVTNGWSHDRILFRKVTGAGAYILDKPSAKPTRRHFLADVSEYTGMVILANGDNESAIFIGRDWKDHADDSTQLRNIFIAGDMPQMNVVSNETGKIIVNDGVTAKMAVPARRWLAKQIEVAASGVLELVTSGNVDDTYAVYTNYVGTGTIRYAGTGWHALPACSTNIWAKTLGLCLEQPEGTLLTRWGAAEDPFVYECGSLSGSGDIRVDFENYANSRSLRVTQSRNSEWSGRVLPCSAFTRDRFHSLIVAGAEGAAEKTLTVSGTNFDNQCPNILRVESTGSVNLTGSWVGDVQVEGELMGSGSATGSVTFGAEATLVCTPGETGIRGTLALAEGVAAIRLALPRGFELTESRYQLLTFVDDQQDIPAFEWVDAADYPHYSLRVDKQGVKLGRKGFAVHIR